MHFLNPDILLPIYTYGASNLRSSLDIDIGAERSRSAALTFAAA